MEFLGPVFRATLFNNETALSGLTVRALFAD